MYVKLGSSVCGRVRVSFRRLGLGGRLEEYRRGRISVFFLYVVIKLMELYSWQNKVTSK